MLVYNQVVRGWVWGSAMQYPKYKGIWYSNIYLMDLSYCYILKSTTTSLKTYNGYTNRIDRRIRQHNKEIRGGAKATSNGGPWEYLVIISSDSTAFTKIKALSLEWSIRYPTNKRPRPKEYSCPSGRIASLPLVFGNPKFQEFIGTWHVYVHDDFYDQAMSLLPQLQVQVHKM
jgi:predicted GIY-YIG superfamily endonuclease